MQNESQNVIKKNRNLLFVAMSVAILLGVVFVANHLSEEVNWTLTDFTAAGILLFGAGATFELITRRVTNGLYRAASAFTVGTALLLVWGVLAVGIIGAETNPANLLYGGVLTILLVGSLIARIRPRGMVWALGATILAHIIVMVIALITQTDLSSFEILAGNGVFLGLWLVAAFLWYRASCE